MTNSKKTKTSTKSLRNSGKPSDTLAMLETMQTLASDGRLDAALTAAGVPKLAAAKTKRRHFSQLIPFDRTALDYEKYSASMSADLARKKD
jgi:hypothetical protein